VEDEARIIREVARRILQGDSITGIMVDLNERNVPTVSGGPWSIATIRTMMLRPRLAGLRQHQGAIVGPAKWPPILDRPTWDAVRVLLSDPSRRPPGQTNARRYVLSGLAKCGVCGTNLKFENPKQASLEPGYECKNPTCRKVRCSAFYLEKFIIKHVVFPRLAERGIKPPSSDGVDDENLNEQIAVLEARLNDVTDEFADDEDVTPGQLRRITHRLRERLNELYGRQAERHHDDVLDGIDGRNVADVWKDLPLARQRAIIGVTVGPFKVYPTNRRGPGFDPDRVDIPPEDERSNGVSN
jgi:site-specific DNA recombinase